jgi:hypothetical protein
MVFGDVRRSETPSWQRDILRKHQENLDVRKGTEGELRMRLEKKSDQSKTHGKTES